MTAQFMDEVRFRRGSYAISAVEGGPLFDPDAHGLHPGPWGTACYRGFVCHYKIAKGRFHLDSLSIALPEEPSSFLTTKGQVAARPSNLERGIWEFEHIRISIEFTGRLLIGSRRAADLPYLNMGFAPAWCFEKVWELTFGHGNLKTASDRSDELALVRHHILEGDKALTGEADYSMQLQDPQEYRSALNRWIQDTFSLSFAYSWPRRPDSSPSGGAGRN